MRSEEAFQESVRSMRNQTLRADRAGDYWTIDIQIRLLFIGLKGPTREETWQTKNMVSV